MSELEEEASSLFERLSALEEELGAAQAQAHSHAQARAAAQADIEASHLPNTSLWCMGFVLQAAAIELPQEAQHTFRPVCIPGAPKM